MNRLAAGIVAIALFAAAAVAAIWLFTRPEGGAEGAPPGAPAPPAPVPPPAPAIPPSALIGPQTPPVAGPAAPPNVYGPPRIEPLKGSWEEVPVVARASALGPVGGAIGRGLNELQPRLAACFDEDTQARYGREAYTRVKDAQPMDEQGATVLVLQIDAGRDEARIVDAPVETRGGASDGLIACAQRVLRGQRFPVVPPGQPGRYRLLHSLTP